MSTDPAPDRAFFEKFLASAHAVQNSGLDSQSLTALSELQRSITTGNPTLVQAMHMVSERARTVADATGVAVAQLIANQLVYRAGSGSGTAYVGRHVTAVLSAPAPDEARAEILRVENAQEDSRIEAEVCRLYGANALLIVPIYREHAVAGVLEVFFSDPHRFEDQEVLTYQIMARLVAEALSADAQLQRKKIEQQKAAAAQLSAVPQVMEPAVPPVHQLHGDEEFAVPPEMRLALSNLRWNVAAAGLAVVLLIVGGLAYRHRSASHANASSLQRSNAAPDQPAAKPSLESDRDDNPEIPAAETADRKAPGSGFRRVRVGQNEVDYIAEDVTIRHFTNPRPQVPAWEKQVNFGNDVTIRYFSSKPPVAPLAQPVPAIERSVER